MNYITNNKGGRKLCHNGYMYTVKAVTNTSTRWECSSRNSLKCHGLLRVDINDQQTILSSTPHSHPASEVDVKVAESKQKIKADLIEIAGAGGSTQPSILRQLTGPERQNFGNPASVKRSFNRYIAQGRPVDPDTLANLFIQGTWAEDMDGDNFLIHDNGNNNNRIIVFGSDKCLEHLSNSSTWFMDGTFKVAPLLFQQLYVIRASLDESAISLVYAFMASKSEASYRELLQIVSDKCMNLGFQLDPTSVMLDFESAMMNAIRNFFGVHVVVKCCFFHLCQNTLKKIQALGLVDRYENDDEIKLFCGMLDALAFLPENLVQNGMQYLSQNTPNGFEPLVAYFDQTYVLGTYRRIARPGQNVVLRNIPPMFPPSVWIVNEATLADGARTNNLCKAWNHSFLHLVGYKHPSIWGCIEGLKKTT